MSVGTVFEITLIVHAKEFTPFWVAHFTNLIITNIDLRANLVFMPFVTQCSMLFVPLLVVFAEQSIIVCTFHFYILLISEIRLAA